MSGSVLLFSLGGESYAIDLDPVESILPGTTLFCIPLQPSFFEGFFDYRGECIPAVSLSRLLGSAQAMERSGGKLLVVRHRGFLTALCVDFVLGTRNFDRSETTVALSALPATPVEIDGQSVILLSLEKLLERFAAVESGA